MNCLHAKEQGEWTKWNPTNVALIGIAREKKAKEKREESVRIEMRLKVFAWLFHIHVQCLMHLFLSIVSPSFSQKKTNYKSLINDEKMFTKKTAVKSLESVCST